MILNIDNWKEFKVSSVFTILNGKGITKEEIETNPGDLFAIQSGEENNGILGKIDEKYCYEMSYTISKKPCLTVARTGSAGFVAFQPFGCVVGDSAKILLLSDEIASTNRYLFLQTILLANRFKYAYGRKVTKNKYYNEYLYLPILHNNDGSVYIDNTYKYSNKGYVPDWNYMESYINSLHHKPIYTDINVSSLSINTNKWEFFFLKDICQISMGNKLDYSAMSFDNPKINFIGRSADNEGVMGKVDVLPDITPYPPGCITVALGGSLGSSFVQTDYFYTSQNVSVLEFKKEVTLGSKLFITTCIRNESKYKYFPFGRELNTHIRTDFGFTLPILRDCNGNPIIDTKRQYSKNGYIPDWKYMENYILSLPYGDRIKV